MFTKHIKGVMIPRHDTAWNWRRATNFTPSKGEIIIYDADNPHDKKVSVPYDTTVAIGDRRYPVVSSFKTRFKIGDGVSNVNALDFVSSVDEEWVKEYVKSRTDVATLLYLNAKETIGQNLELQDVFPVQSDRIRLEVVSKNMLPRGITNKSVSGVNIVTNNSVVTLTGKATEKITADVDLAEVTFKCPGKYVLSSSTWGLGVEDGSTATKKCYLTYSLFDNNNSAFCTSRKLVSNTNYIELDTRELNCSKIKIKLRLDVPSGATFENSNSLEFKLQLESGDTPTPHSLVTGHTDVEEVRVNIYGRNLYNDKSLYDDTLTNLVDFPLPQLNDSVSLNGAIVGTIKPYSKYYFKGVMTEDTYITYSTSSNPSIIKIKTPLKKGDKFTFIYMVNMLPDGTVLTHQHQIVYGHTDYEEYHKFEMVTVQSGEAGVCDINKLNYPYTFINIDESEPNRDRLSVYVQYDPALSRNWTEKELDRLKSLIGTSGGSTPGATTPVKGVDYWTATDKQEIVDSVLSSLELSTTGIKLNDAVTEDTYTLYVADGKLTLRKESDQ
jgi:hypothetical protein